MILLFFLFSSSLFFFLLCSRLHAVIRVAVQCCCHFLFYKQTPQQNIISLASYMLYNAIFFPLLSSVFFFLGCIIYVSIIIIFASCAYLEILFNGVCNWVEIIKNKYGIQFFVVVMSYIFFSLSIVQNVLFVIDTRHEDEFVVCLYVANGHSMFWRKMKITPEE